MNLIELTKRCAEAIPDFPKKVNSASSKGRVVFFKYIVNGVVHEGTAQWRLSVEDPEQGFALCHFFANGQEWAFRLYEHNEKIHVFSVGLPKTGRPHRLFTCDYDASTLRGTCSLCGKYAILKQGEYSAMLPQHQAMRFMSAASLW